MAIHEELLSMAQSLTSEVSKLQTTLQEAKPVDVSIIPQLTRIAQRLQQLGQQGQAQVAVAAQGDNSPKPPPAPPAKR